MYINRFLMNVSLLYPLKTLENRENIRKPPVLRFSCFLIFSGDIEVDHGNGRMDTGQFMAKLCQHLKKLSRILMQNLQSSFVFNKNSRLICSNFPTKNNFLTFFQNTSRWLLLYQLYSLINTKTTFLLSLAIIILKNSPLHKLLS